MAKKSAIEKEKRRERMVKNAWEKRAELRKRAKDTEPFRRRKGRGCGQGSTKCLATPPMSD